MAPSFYDRDAVAVIRRPIRIAGLAIALLLLVAIATGYWLLQTSAGASWVWNRATASIPGELDAASVSGSLSDGFRLTGVTYESESLNVAIASLQLVLDLDAFSPAVNISGLHIDGAVVQLLESQSPQEPAAAFELKSLALPVQLNIDSFVLNNLRVLNADGKQLFGVDNAELAGVWYEKIALSRLVVDSSAGSVNGVAALQLSAPYDANASLNVTYPLQLGETKSLPVPGHVNAKGNLEKLQIEVTVEEPNLRVAGTLFELTDKPAWDLQVQSEYLQWPLTGQAPDLYMRNVRLQTSGGLTEYSVSGDGVVSLLTDTGELRFSLHSNGDRDSFTVSGLALHGMMLDAGAEGVLKWSDGIAIAAHATIDRFDPSVLLAEWPRATPVTGTINAAWSGEKIELSDVRLRIRETDQIVTVAGLVDLDRGVVDVDLDWQELQWPIESTSAQYRSAFGHISVSGKPESWTLDGKIALETAELPQGIFLLSGAGNTDEMAVTLHESQVLGGTVAGRIEYRWKDGGHWSTRLLAGNIDIGPLAPGWPGRISTKLIASGRQEPMQVDVEIDYLDGVIRDQPVHAEGGIHYAGGKLRMEAFQIAFGDAVLYADGSWQSDAGLDFSIEADSLASVYPAAAGSLQTHGSISLAGEFPQLNIDLQARDLAWREYGLEELTLTSDDSPAPVEFVANGHGLTIGDYQVDSFAVELAASEAKQQLELLASAEDKQIAITLDGRLENWRRPFDSAWSGRLTALQLKASDDVTFALTSPTGLHLGADHLSLDRACLAGNEDSRICLAANWAGPSAFSVETRFVDLPVNLVTLAFATDLEFTQTLDGFVSASDAPGRQLAAQAHVNISPGQIRNQIDSRLAMRTSAGTLSLNLHDGQLLSGRFNLPFDDGAEIDARFELVDLARGSRSNIDGALKVNLDDIGVVATVFPSINAASGQLDIDIALAGTLEKPVFSGEASLREGALSYLPLGLKLTAIELQSELYKSNRIDLISTFKAGEGYGEIRSSAESLGEIGDGVELSLSGENLTVIDLPQINVVADMDIRLAVSQDKLELNGSVLIPRARLSPVNITSQQVSESEDVVIVAGKTANNGTEADKSPPVAMYGEIELELGKDVAVELDVAEARLHGTSRFEWNGPVMPIGHGEYGVTGKLEAYGQLLEITEGTIGYPAVPAFNPVLRIRAERKIFGNPRIRSAGVLISGTAQDPEIDVYTTPRTNKETALALLVTGSDFNYEQGVGAVDVGTYIAPDLYLSYGISLFGRENVISVRYDLAKGFGIKWTSGQRTEGVDLSYTIEN